MVFWSDFSELWNLFRNTSIFIGKEIKKLFWETTPPHERLLYNSKQLVFVLAKFQKVISCCNMFGRVMILRSRRMNWNLGSSGARKCFGHKRWQDSKVCHSPILAITKLKLKINPKGRSLPETRSSQSCYSSEMESWDFSADLLSQQSLCKQKIKENVISLEPSSLPEPVWIN